MEDLECLLEILDKTPKHKLTGREIKDELKDRKIPPNILEKLILDAFESGLITPDSPTQKTEASNSAYIDGISYVLANKGLDRLTQIRIKNTIEQLDKSIKKALLGNLMLASSYNSIRMFPAYSVNVTLVRCNHESN